MKKKLLLFSISFLFIVYSCSEKQENKESIKVDLNNRNEVSIFSIFSKIEIIPLETNDSSLIKAISKIIVDNDTLYILDNEMSKILVFNKSGNYLYSIDHKGRGPGEYTSTSDINVFDDDLFVLSSLDNKLYIYTKSGDLKKTIHLPNIVGAYYSFVNINKDLIAFWTFDYDNRLKIYSHSAGQMIHEHFPDKDNIFTNIEMPIFPYDKYVSRVNNNTVYKITDHGDIIEGYKWDFGKLNNTHRMIKNAPKIKSQEDMIENIDKINSSKIINYYFIRAGGNARYIYTKLNRKNRHFNIFYDKLHKKSIVFDQTIENVQLFPLFWSDNYMIGFIPDIITEIDDIIPDNILNEKNIQLKRNLSQFDNPILVKYYFKQ